MPRAVPLVASFNGGEISPLLYGRVDIQKYATSCREMVNFLPKSQGPAVRRPGTRYVANTRLDRVARLIPFEFSTSQTYIIEASQGVFRFYKDGALIETSPGVPYELPNTVYGEPRLPELRWAQSADQLFFVHPEVVPLVLTRFADTNWTLTPVAFGDGPYEPERTDITLTPSGTSGTITITASAALFTNADIARPVRLRHGSSWTWAVLRTLISPTQMTADTGGTVASATAGFRLGAWYVNGSNPSLVGFHENRLFFAATDAHPQTVWGSRTGDYFNFTPGAAADDSVVVTLRDNQINRIEWMVSAKGLLLGTTGGEYAVTASANNEALTPANVKANKQTLIGSAGVRPVQVGPATLFVQRARRTLHEMAYTFEADGFSAPELSVLAQHLTRGNIKDMAWQAEPWRVLWLVMDDGSLVGMTYMREQQVVAWHRHVLGGDAVRVLSLATIAQPNSSELWMVVERLQDNVVKRFVERLGDEFYADRRSDQDDACFVDCSVSSSVLRPDSTLRPTGVAGTINLRALSGTWAAGDVGKIVRVNGGKVLVTVYVSDFLVTGTVQRGLQSAAPAYSGEWTVSELGSSFAGLDHLEGETVQILADGATHPDKVVASGSVTLDNAASVVHVGYGYTSRLETLDLQAGAADGTASTRKKRIHTCGVRFFQTLGGYIGYRDEETGAYALEEIQYRQTNFRMDVPPLLFTGDRLIEFPGRWERAANVVIEQRQPLPMTITALAPRVTANE
jgi:hypothetical protein